MNRLNAPALIAAFVTAVLLWFVVTSQNSVSTIVTMEVRIQGLDDDRLFVTKVQPTVAVNARGNPRETASLSGENAYAYIDLQGAKPGRSTYPVRFYPDGVDRFLINPPRRITVELEAVVQKELPVSIQTSGSLREPGFVLDEVLADPPTVTVRGPKSEVDQIVRVKAVLNLAEVTATKTGPYPADVTAETDDGRQMRYVRPTPFEVRLSARLLTAPVERQVFVEPDFAGRPAAGFEITGYRFDPPRVTLSGASIELARLSRVVTEPIDLNDLRENRVLNVGLRTPAGVRASPRQVRVTIEVGPRQAPSAPEPARPDPEPKMPPLDPPIQPRTTGGGAGE